MDFDIHKFLIELTREGYKGSRKLIAYLISEGLSKKEIKEICLNN